MKTDWDVIVIGGGPAGLMAAGRAAEHGSDVLIIEKNEIMGKKLLISGGGRCNITNAEPDERILLSKFGKKGNFLFTPFSIFGVQKTIKFFENLGVKTKVEDHFRVFPVSNKSADVLEALVKSAKSNGVEFQVGTGVKKILWSGKHIDGVLLENDVLLTANSVILATGGKSHPETGSTGDGFRWLKNLGHTIVEPVPSLVPIKTKEPWVAELAGISLQDASVHLYQNGKKVASKDAAGKGRILFTHEGLSGPTIINMSKKIRELLEDEEYDQKSEVKVAIDFFPGMGLDKLNEILIKTFENNPRKILRNLEFKEVPQKIYLKILEQIGLDEEWYANEVKRDERILMMEKFIKFELTVDSLLGYDKAIISSGGVDLSEVDFKGMRSRLFDNLFLIGDVLDFDRPSGGYSLQLCWTTGYVAGKFCTTKFEQK